MSKIGKKNIVVPKESSIKIEGGNLTVTGPKGTKKLTINEKIFSSKLNENKFEIHLISFITGSPSKYLSEILRLILLFTSFSMK